MTNSDDDQELGTFHAPEYEDVPTPPAVRAAGARLHAWAKANNVAREVAIFDLPIPDSDVGLQRDMRLMKWFIALQEGS
ncbi:MAG TPA: hypothetical protein VGJ60_11230 [Chloroflexota bacterium]|jgi:hypothetical protein